MPLHEAEPAAAPIQLGELPDAFLLVDAAGHAELLNAAAERMFGIDRGARAPVEALFSDASLLIGPLRTAFAAPLRLRLEGLRSNGVPFAADLSVAPSEHGAVCSVREIARGRDSGEAQRYFDFAFENAPIGMALFNTDGEYTRVNRALCELLGRASDELIGCRDQDLTHPDDRAADIEPAWRVLRGEIAIHQCEKRFLRPDGSIVWTIANLTFLRDERGLPLNWVGIFQDITASKHREIELNELADRDPLTGLLNRRSLERRFNELAAASQPLAVVLVDLDGFKTINDRHGHAAGDEVLIAIAGELAGRVRKGDHVARVGGDEFVALLPGADAAGAGAFSSDLLDAVATLEVAGAQIDASVGVAVSNGRRRHLGPLLAEADERMYAAKRARCAGL